MQLPDANQLLERLATAIRADLRPDTCLVGIHTGGVWVARHLHRMLGLTTPLGSVHVAFYRDDYKKKGLAAGVQPSDLTFEVEDSHIVLVDDVLYTGRTIRAAMNEIFDFGRPTSIRLAALVDRGGRQLPICPQYVGATLDVPREKLVQLRSDADSGRLWLELVERGVTR